MKKYLLITLIMVVFTLPFKSSAQGIFGSTELVPVLTLSTENSSIALKMVGTDKKSNVEIDFGTGDRKKYAIGGQNWVNIEEAVKGSTITVYSDSPKEIGKLYCSNNNITSLDVGKCVSLEVLHCWNNKISNLNLNELGSLTELRCANNELKSLNIIGCKDLEILDVDNNQLKAVDANYCKDLQQLFVSNNQVLSVKVESCPDLTELNISNNKLNFIDLSKNGNLSYLNCSENGLNDLKLAGNSKLKSLNCANNRLNNLSLIANPLVEELIFDNNNVTTIEIVNLSNLKRFSGVSNSMSSLNLASNKKLKSIDCSKNNLVELFTSYNDDLEYLVCDENQIESMDVSMNKSLEHLSISNNPIAYLNTSQNTGLENLYCSTIKTKLLDISNNLRLINLDCSNNELVFLNVSENRVLETLVCDSNKLFEIEVLENPNLRYLSCVNIQTSMIDVSENPALEVLNCSYNRIVSIDLTNNKLLTELNCNNNLLTDLDLENNKDLQKVYCMRNQIIFANLPGLGESIDYQFGFQSGSMLAEVEGYVNREMHAWLERGKYEKGDEYTDRTSPKNRAIKINQLTVEKTNELASQIQPEIDAKEYDADNEIFKVSFTEFNPVYVKVPISEGEAEVFGKMDTELVIENPAYALSKSDQLIITALELVNSSNGKKYAYKNTDTIIFQHMEIASADLGNFKVDVNNLEDDNNVDEITKKLSMTGLSDVDINIPVTESSRPNTFALIIGNEDYISYQEGLGSNANVPYAEQDAKTFYDYCIKTLGIPESNVTLLTDAHFMKMNKEIGKIQKLASKVPNSEILFYYAGHGMPDEKTQEPHLIPVDVSATDLTYAINLKTLYQGLTANSNKTTVFLDACFSGGAREQGLLAARGMLPNKAAKPVAGNIIVFSATAKEQSALGYNEKTHGMFTYYLLKTLQDNRGDLTLGKLSEELQRNVSLKSIQVNSKEQDPQTIVSPSMEKTWKEEKL